MRAVVQRVSEAKVTVNDEIVGSIKKGLLVLLGVGNEDSESDVKYLSDKISNLRIFEDENEKMNLSLIDIKGELLIVSQFTLFGDVRKGKRPNFTNAAHPKMAEELYLDFIEKCKNLGLNKVDTGIFGANMDVSLVNDGPVTILLDSNKGF
ncbi:D-tyrosyl-tRNA(Tyr) deacylase Dtd [Gottschalkia purinilytica]|uniref:D-aminoacyl-tRNA deacylase n=1 Tax=Gottschalkia purinilytica TaxID=1503 RepID=A0A0L0WBI0_GOTPU|nr:D-aminoacyl-tRNA deacylase [Gottschalkia purinilytica]KNF08700.1 D-tyrosyl-tRNA(Tyr) deacylase Dtd [Gottschalkia purinilytica]